MSEKLINEYRPDTVSIPGETLREVLDDRGMSQAELADRMGRPKKTINEIVKGKAEVTPETALQLERVLGIPAPFWTNLERNYRDYVATLSERESLKGHKEWLGHFPLKKMEQLGWLQVPEPSTERVRSLLTFFSVSSMEQWKQRYQREVVAFRLPQRFSPDIYALTAWLRQGEREAYAIKCAPFEPAQFRESLRGARALTREAAPEVFVPDLRRLCAAAGVAVVFLPELKSSRACGATRWLGPQKALIQLSLRYKSNDQLWFTFFHEAGHIVLHRKREAFVEVRGGSSGSALLEGEANRFAADYLIPRALFEKFVEEGRFDTASVRAFAERIGIAPGIVAGRLQHDHKVAFNRLNDLKIRYRWAHES